MIECNGIQHYEPVEFFGGNIKFIQQKRSDQLKHEYALNNNYNYLVLDCRRKNLKNVKSILEKYFN